MSEQASLLAVVERALRMSPDGANKSGIKS